MFHFMFFFGLNSLIFHNLFQIFFLFFIEYIDAYILKFDKAINGIHNQSLTLKALPSVSLHFPPVGLLRIFLQLLQATTV